MSEGQKFDDDKLDYSLVPWPAMAEVVKVLMFGAKKYAPNNWKHVDNAKRRYLSAVYRHINAYAEGEKIDGESGLMHLAHAVCCLLFMIWFENNEKA